MEPDSRMKQEQKTVLIVGVGNALLSDEGLGVHVARALLDARASLPPQVDVLDAGTALLDVLPEMYRYAQVILVDAVRAGREPGTLCRAELGADLAGPAGFPPPVSLHQWDLLETLRIAALLGQLPKQLTLVGAEPECLAPGTELSPKLKRAAQQIASLLRAETGSRLQSGIEKG